MKKKEISVTSAHNRNACVYTCNEWMWNRRKSANGNYDGELVYDHSMELEYAKLFSVDYYKGGYKLITITNRDEDTAIVSKQSKLLLVPEGMSTPSGIDSDTVVLNAPVTNMLVSSTPVTSLMNASNCLSGISQVTYDKKSWYIDAVKQAFDDGKLTYVGDYKAPDYETINSRCTNTCNILNNAHKRSRCSREVKGIRN